MFASVARQVASRVAVRAVSGARSFSRSSGCCSRLSALRSHTPVLAITVRHLSTKPPTFLDPAEVQDRIVTVVGNFDQVDPLKVTADSTFEDLALDSLDIVEVVMAIEDEFAIEIPDQESDKISSIKDAVDYISTHPMAK